MNDMNEQDIYRPEGLRLGTDENGAEYGTLAAFEHAMEHGTILEGRAVRCDAGHDLLVDLGRYVGVIPFEEAAYSIDGSRVRDIAVITRVGKSVCFTVKGIEDADGTPRILLSRREAQKRCFGEYVSHLRSGDIIDARVTHIEPFGAFCDIGCGLISLLPVDAISVSRIRHPRERMSCGDVIRCAVKDIDTQTGRVTLTMKELLGTWEENAALFAPGETAAGIIRSVEPYGVFVELTPNLAGLAEWCADAVIGRCAAVYIKSIIPEKMKVKLVIVDSNYTCAKVEKPRYFIESGHIDTWTYSPRDCTKEITTVFGAEE